MALSIFIAVQSFIVSRAQSALSVVGMSVSTVCGKEKLTGNDRPGTFRAGNVGEDARNTQALDTTLPRRPRMSAYFASFDIRRRTSLETREPGLVVYRVFVTAREVCCVRLRCPAKLSGDRDYRETRLTCVYVCHSCC